jgi:hypothetical protein
MESPKRIRKEHKRVCQAMKVLRRRGGRFNRTPLPDDEDLYGRLATVKMTLEWVHPFLIKTMAKGADRINILIGHKHFSFGPVHAVLFP